MTDFSSISFWFVALITVLVAVSLTYAMRGFWRKFSTVFGILYVALMLILVWSLFPVNHTKHALSANVSTDGVEMKDHTTLKSIVVNEVKDRRGSWLDLSKDRRQFKEIVSQAHASGQIPVLYAGSGIDGFYTDEVERVFGKVKATEDSEQKLVCFAANSVLGFRSGICEARDVRLILQEPKSEALAKDSLGRIVAATAFVRGRPVVLLTYQITGVKSAEESCLTALSEGASCLTPTLFPKFAQHILIVNPGPFEEEFASFGLDKPQGDTRGCASLTSAKIIAAPLDDSASQFADIRSELELDRFIAEILRPENFSSISYLNLVHLTNFEAGSSGEKALVRSLFTKLLRSPVWLTDCNEVLARHGSFTKLEYESDKKSLVNLKGVNGTPALKLILTSPTTVSGQSLAQIAVSGATGWSFGLVNERSAQLVIPNGSAKISVKVPKVEISPFSTNQDTRLILLLALIFGGSASLLQTVAIPKHRQSVGFHSGTALPVVALFFISIWYSYQASLAEGTGSDAITEVASNVAMPLPVSQIPESFFRDAEQQEVAGVSQQLEKILSLIPITPDNKLKLVKREPLAQKLNYKQNVEVLLHNSIAARNYFYRKSPAYSAAVSAIEQTLIEKKIEFKIIDDDEVFAELKNKSSILIVPDIRFFPAEAATELAVWVRAGGVLVFADQLDVNLPVIQSPVGSLLLEVFGALYSRIEAAPWSKVSTVAGEFEVDHSHRIISNGATKTPLLGRKLGNGAVVFFGAHPSSIGSSLLFEHILKNLTGQTLQASMEKICNTMLVVEPYQLTKPEYETLAQNAGKQTVALGIDSQSFPNMVDQWKDKKDFIAVIDDGQWRQRYLVHEIFRVWLELPSVFLRRESDKFSLEGPDAVILLARYGFSKADTAAGLVREWRQGCVQGYANPRIVSAGWLKKNANSLFDAMTNADLRSLKPSDLAESAKVVSPEGIMRLFSVPKHEPLNFTNEVAQ